jgi:hypothetical protein
MYLMNGGFKSYVVISVDNGNNWIELSGAPSDLIGFDFSSDRGFYCWSKDHLYFSLNEGKDWAIANIVDYRKILNRVSPIIDKDNGIWLAFKDKIVCFNLNGTSDIYPLEHGFEVLSMAQNLEGNKYILVRDAGISMIRILVLSLSSQFVPIKEMPDVYVWNFSLLDPGFVILAADKVKDNSNFLILGENFEEPLRKVEPPSKYLLSGELLTVNDSGHLLLMTNSGRLLEVNLRE